MKKIALILAIVIMLTMALAGTALAITDGELDGDGHPNVGLMVALDGDGNPLWRCSGTMLSPTVFLTAGHCTESPAARATIWFDADVQSGIPDNGYPFSGDVFGTTYTYPGYATGPWWMNDVGVVVLDEPYVLDEYGALPEVGQLDALKTKRGQNKTFFTAVGYGLQQSFPDAASWKDVAERVRMVAYPRLIQINVPGSVGNFSLLLSNNANTGGTCFGDSGGPNFFEDTNMVAAVTSFGKNGNCAGQGGVFRMDQPDVHAWVSSFLD
jgi:secreted trypsin-like serine protease